MNPLRRLWEALFPAPPKCRCCGHILVREYRGPPPYKMSLLGDVRWTCPECGTVGPWVSA